MLVISSSTDARDSGEKVFFMSLSACGKSFESATATRFKYRWFYCGGCEWLPEEHVMAPLGDMDVFVSHKITLLITVFSLQLQPQDNICNLHLEHVRGLSVKHLVVSSCLTHPAGVLQGLSFPSQRLHLCVYKGQHSSTRGLLVLILCVLLHTTAMLCVSVTSYLSRVLFDLL